MSSVSVPEPGPGLIEQIPEEITCENSIIPSNPIISTVKTLPLVYIQAPKFPITTKSNMLVNAVPQLQFATTNKSVILTPVQKVGKSHQQIVIAKPGSNMQTLPGAYLTMLKPLTKIQPSPAPPSDPLPAASDESSKFVIAPMPKVITNRLPVTVTTNSLQPKLFMPLPISAATTTSSDMFNFKIKDGQIQNKLCCEDVKSNACDEVINLDSPVKSDKEYELSILEDKSDLIIEQLDNSKRKESLSTPKYTKHGISILKKHHQNDNKHRNNIISTSTPISSSNNNSSVLDQDIEIHPIINKQPQKSERRRKSNFSYRKDYDDMEIVEEKSEIIEVSKQPEHNKENDDFQHEPENTIKAEKKPDINMNDDCDLQKILKWEEGVGTLPGSSLKFIINEFGILEYVTKDDFTKFGEKKTSAKSEKNKIKNEFNEDIRCQECGCYGLPSEFVTAKYCSLDCKETGAAKELNGSEVKLKRKRKRANNSLNNQSSPVQAPPQLKKEVADPLKLESSEDDNTSNENSQDKYLYPWLCSKKGFSWTKYLEHIKAKAAPVKLFKDPFPYTRNMFRPGMRLEGVDPQHPSYFCVLTVVEVIGYRLRLNFDGYPDLYDFWVNADSLDIFPVGWCEKHGRALLPPPGYTVDNFNWVNYLKLTKSTAAPKHLFPNRVSNTICPNGFRVGMKLEAVDRKNLNLVCVATVKDMMDNRILVHFDSWDDIYDYWVDPTSPYIHPVGWCDQTGHNLTPPNDYPNPSTFSWEKYLKETKSVAAPVRAFKQRQPNAFKIGMRLECVDKRMPRFIRVAHVSDVLNHQIRVHFDGWREIYSYWIDDDSSELHPIGWCQKTGHPLEQPLTPEDVYDTEDCPTAGCRGIGHASGQKTATHSEREDCPYDDYNLIEKPLKDRLLTPDRMIEAVVPVSREPKEKPKPKLGRPPKFTKFEILSTSANEIEEVESPAKKQKRKYKKRKLSDKEEPELKLKEALELIERSKIKPATKESWPRHSKFLNKYLYGIDEPVEVWDEDRVEEFVGSIPGCEDHAHYFKSLEIDGEAFLSLSQEDLTKFMFLKFGHAIKLYNIIILLRQRFSHHAITFS